MAIGKKIKTVMEFKNISVNLLSEKSGVSYQTITSIIKRDSNKVDADILFSLCDALKIPMDFFREDEVITEEKIIKAAKEQEENKFIITEKKLVNQFNELNDKAKDMVRTYVSDLSLINKYKK